MSFIDLTLYIALAVGLYMTIGFIVAMIAKRNDLVDVMWGLGFIVICVIIATLPFLSIRTILVLVLVVAWGMRLTIHILVRMKKTEDFRYKAWRDTWMQKGKAYFMVRSYFQIFLLQGLLMMVIALPILVTASFSQLFDQLSWWALIGALVWLVGFLFETIGDAQLHHFLSHPNSEGKLMTSGLWKYTRHPNYFGEVTQWWGIFLIVFPLSFGWLAILSPFVITYLILFISGIPMMEKRFESFPGFEDYKRRTSSFFPLLPRA